METLFPSLAWGETTAVGWMPAGGRGAPPLRCSATLPNARSGLRTERVGMGAGVPSATMTADALVAARSGAYFELARKVMSPGPASLMPFTARMTVFPSPVTFPPTRRASSSSVTSMVKNRPSLFVHRGQKQTVRFWPRRFLLAVGLFLELLLLVFRVEAIHDEGGDVHALV